MLETEMFPQPLSDLDDAGWPAISLVVPVYNEECTADEYSNAVEALEACGRPYETIFAGDGSTDGIWVVLTPVGEYLGRIQPDVEGRPLYTIESELED